MACLRAAPLILAIALCCLLRASSAQASTSKDTGKAAVEPMEVAVYADGSLTNDWHDGSKGCMRCNWADASTERRNGSKAVISVSVAAWGSLVFSSDAKGYSKSGVLDFWTRGSGLTAISLYFIDSKANTITRDVRFTRADQLDDDTVNVLSSDNDGWIHMQVNIAKLANSAQASCGSNQFDRIIFEDVSGMGFNLQLDTVRLLFSAELLANFNAASFSFPTLRAAQSTPVWGDDLTSLKSAPNRYIMKLKDNTAVGDVSAICSELAGKSNLARRFKGVCLSAINNTGNNLASWHLMTVSVNSKADLNAMRQHLGSKIDYFEADLTAFSTIRQIRAVTQDASRPTWATPVDAEPNSVQTGFRPAWAEPVEMTTVPASPQTKNITGNGTVVAVPGPNNVTVFNNSAQNVSKGSMIDSIVNPEDTGDLVAHIQPVSEDDDGDSSVGAVEQTAHIQSVSSWGLDRLNQYALPLDGYYSSGDFDGRGVHIYILDTGARTSHQDFRGRVGDGASAVGSSVFDDNGHGTHVAGTAINQPRHVAATSMGAIHGVARSAILHPVKVLGADGAGSYSNIIAGMQWVKDHKTKNGIQSAIISMSLAGPRSAALNDAVEAMAAAGIIVVTAAGNNRGADACTMSPCSAPSAITVGAATDKDALASFSNIGSCLAIFAPGTYITSASPSSDTAEATMSGTSMAAPHVAGVAALYLQYRPGASAAEVKAALQRAAVGVYFESSSPKSLLNAMSDRLRAAAPQASRSAPAPTPTTTTPTTTTPTPTKPSICSICSWCSFCN